jgi:DNA-binding transcriptional MocR family regulator
MPGSDSVSATLYGQGGAKTIQLSKGHPNPRLLPLGAVAEAFAKSREQPHATEAHLQYGAPQGPEVLREQLVQLLQLEAGVRSATAENIMITNGSGQALDMICSVFLSPGDTVVVEDPTYFLAFYTFRDYHLNVVSIPTDDQGMQVSLLEQQLAEDATFRPALVYTIPICQNPTGVTMSEERMQRLVDLSRRYKFKIASDEVYLLLAFNAEKQPNSLRAFDDPDDPTVLAMHSFSKILGPGVRLGWIEAHPRYIERFLLTGLLLSGGGLNPFMAAIATELLRSGFQRAHLRQLRTHYAAACKTLCDSLDRSLQMNPSIKVVYRRPQGGFFVWLLLPEEVDAASFLNYCVQEHGVSFFEGARFTVNPVHHRSAIRLCFAWLEPAELSEGARRLVQALRSYLTLRRNHAI